MKLPECKLQIDDSPLLSVPVGMSKGASQPSLRNGTVALHCNYKLWKLPFNQR